MANIGKAIQTILASDSGVSALVSTRIYPDRLPQNVTYPAIVFEHNGERSDEHMGGLSGLADSYFDVFCWAKSRLATVDLADAVRLALSRYNGTAGGVVVRQIHPGEGRTDHDEPSDDSDVPTYWQEREFHAFYTEATS